MSKGALGLLSAYWPEDTPRYAHIPLKTLGEVAVHANVEKHRDHPALVSAARTLTYGHLSDAVLRFAAGLRGRYPGGVRIAIALEEPAELLIAALGAFEAEALVFLSVDIPPRESLSAFAPDLVIGPTNLPGTPAVSFDEVLTWPAKERVGRPNFRAPVLALARPDGQGEVVHVHRSLVATAIAVGAFFMLAPESRVVLLEPPTAWHTLGFLLGTLQRSATTWAAWGKTPGPVPDRADYLVCSWKRGATLPQDSLGHRLPRRIGAGVILGIEGYFSVSRRRHLSRRLTTPVLTLLGRNDLGPVLGSHPTWFLDDAAGIPLPNVDTRPLDPSDGRPLAIGWDAVEQAEIGVKSALSPAGGIMVEGWLRSAVVAEVDPTGLYFLQPESVLKPT